MPGPSCCALAGGVELPNPTSAPGAARCWVLQAASAAASPAANANDRILLICSSQPHVGCPKESNQVPPPVSEHDLGRKLPYAAIGGGCSGHTSMPARRGEPISQSTLSQ